MRRTHRPHSFASLTPFGRAGWSPPAAASRTCPAPTGGASAPRAPRRSRAMRPGGDSRQERQRRGDSHRSMVAPPGAVGDLWRESVALTRSLRSLRSGELGGRRLRRRGRAWSSIDRRSRIDRQPGGSGGASAPRTPRRSWAMRPGGASRQERQTAGDSRASQAAPPGAVGNYEENRPSLVRFAHSVRASWMGLRPRSGVKAD